MKNIFLSHKTADKPVAEKIKIALEALGYKVWYDVTALYPGEQWPKAIAAGVRDTDAMIVLWTEAVKADPHWVEFEYNIALAMRKPVIPVYFEGVDLPDELLAFQGILYSDPDQVAKAINKRKQKKTGADDEQVNKIAKEIGKIEEADAGKALKQLNKIVSDSPPPNPVPPRKFPWKMAGAILLIPVILILGFLLWPREEIARLIENPHSDSLHFIIKGKVSNAIQQTQPIHAANVTLKFPKDFHTDYAFAATTDVNGNFAFDLDSNKLKTVHALPDSIIISAKGYSENRRAVKNNDMDVEIFLVPSNSMLFVVQFEDENGNPLKNQKVKVKGIETTTDENGFVKMKLEGVNKGDKIPVSMAGRTLEYDHLIFNPGRGNLIRIQPDLKPIIQTRDDLPEFKMVFVGGGTFMMGSNDGSDDEKSVHKVTVSNFYIGKYEVTQKQWTMVMGNNPSSFKNCDQCPVESVSWNDVKKFIDALNSKSKIKYRLPTEAEWEFAARGGNYSKGLKYSGSNDVKMVAWYKENSGGKIHSVGLKPRNELDIYDMSGNVWELCQDLYYKSYDVRAQIPILGGPNSSNDRVARGGSWGNYASDCRVSNRHFSKSDNRTPDLGFRLAWSAQ